MSPLSDCVTVDQARNYAILITGGPSARINNVNETYANVTLALERCCATKMRFQYRGLYGNFTGLL